ncbi:MAG: FtsB family cell division protein [Magnetospiraceae bacterium]
MRFSLPKRLKVMIAPMLAVCVAGYFVYHAVEGERGLRTYLSLKRQLAEAERVNDDLSQQKRILENRVSRLRPESLDLDLLEERAGVMLGYAQAEDRVLAESR